MERVWVNRLRWRMRGAWLWPCFALLTLVDGVLIHRLPPYAEGPGTFVGGLLVAGFANLLLVAVVAPLAGRRLRRRRRDLPRVVADDYAGTVLVGLLAVVLVVAGLAHRPAREAERADEAAAVAGAHDYVVRSAPPEYRSRLAELDVLRLEEDKYRSCVPGPDPRHWLCVFVDTDQRPAGVTLDPDEVPNAAYRTPGGFR
ncbi:MAG TPA: hypothetical protein VF533_15105 [Solirubrobacteraceae bacterium]